MDNKQTRRGRQRGHTLPEVMIAGSLSFVISAAIMQTFLWAGRQSNLCSKIAWSQGEAMRTSGKLEGYIRNAKSVSAIDESQGNWVEVRFTNGASSRFTYYPTAPREGRIYLTRPNAPETLIAQGLTRIMTDSGYPTPMFTKINDRAIRVCYRVSEPTQSGTRSSDDQAYSACARFGVCLRNAPY